MEWLLSESVTDQAGPYTILSHPDLVSLEREKLPLIIWDMNAIRFVQQVPHLWDKLLGLLVTNDSEILERIWLPDDFPPIQNENVRKMIREWQVENRYMEHNVNILLHQDDMVSRYPMDVRAVPTTENPSDYYNMLAKNFYIPRLLEWYTNFT
jgi:hypothetical protein